MEGCPKVLMISYDIKEPTSADFSTPISNYIRDFYNENPDSYKNEIQQLNQLKKSISNVTRDNQGCSTYRRYFAQLQFLQSRFPMALGGTAAIPFIWYDVYTGDPVTQKDIRYEQASVLFNLGGLYSQLGSNEARTTDESMKVACTYFQCASGAFQYLRENFVFDSLPDMGTEILQLKSIIMLSQAQECLLEKSIRDNRKNTLIARISMQINDYYQEAAKLLQSNGTAEMGSQLRKSWSKHILMKVNMYAAIAFIYMSDEADHDQKYGEKVAYLKAATNDIKEAIKISKSQPEQVLEPLKFLQDVVANKLDAAVKENEFVYHALVPEREQLPEIKGVSLVKAVPFQYNDSSISGPDIFQRLIPMRAHEASSLYSEEKANLLRKISAEIEEKDLHLSESLTSMHIDDLMNPVDDSLPENLSNKCKELRDAGEVVLKTSDQIKELAMLSEEFETIFADLSTKLKSIEEYEREAKVGDGEGGISAELEGLKQEFMQFNDANEKARSTNVTLCNHFEESKSIIELLTGPEDQIIASLPSQNFIDAPIDEPVVQRIRELLAAVDKMKNQRKDLEKQLRDQLNKDDVTSLLVIKEDGNQDTFFREQLQKHDDKISIIRQNLSAQENILNQLTEANAKYAPTRVAALEIANKREAQIQNYLAHAAVFLEVQDRLGHGLTFYKDLKETLTKFEKKVGDFYQRREKEKAKFLEKKKKDTPPPRPTAAKPTFDRASKPSSGRPAPSTQHEGGQPYNPQSQSFPPTQQQGIPMQRPNLPGTQPLTQYQNMPPGAQGLPRMMATGTVPSSGYSPLPSPGQPQNQVPPGMMQPNQMPQQQQPQQPRQQQQQDQQQPNQQQRFQTPVEMMPRFVAPVSTQPRFFTAPQGDELRPRFITTSGNRPMTNRFPTPGQVPSQPISTFQAISSNMQPPRQTLPGQSVPPQMPQQGPPQRMMPGPQGQLQRPMQRQAEMPPRGLPQGLPHMPPQGPPQSLSQGLPQGAQMFPQGQSQRPSQGLPQGGAHLPLQRPQQGVSMQPRLPGQNLPPASSLGGGMPQVGMGQIRGMSAPDTQPMRFPMDQPSQQFRPYDPSSMQRPQSYSQQNIRNPYPQQPQFAGPRGLPASGMDHRMFDAQGQMQQPTEANVGIGRQEFRPQFQQMQHGDNVPGQGPQRQPVPVAGQFRPQTPVQIIPQDPRFAQEVTNRMQGPQTGIGQVVGQRPSVIVDRRNSGQDFMPSPQGMQGPFVQDQRSTPSQYMQRQVSVEGNIRYPVIQQQFQPGLRLPEPLMPERAMPQSLLDTTDAEAMNKPLDLMPTPVKCETESSGFSNAIPAQTMPSLPPGQRRQSWSTDGEALLQRRGSQDQMRGQVMSPGYPNKPGGSQVPHYFPPGKIPATNNERNETVEPQSIMQPGDFSMKQLVDKSQEGPMMTGTDNTGNEKVNLLLNMVSGIRPPAPAGNQYALQGPMSSPALERGGSVSTKADEQSFSFPRTNPNFPRPTSDFTTFKSDHMPSAPPVSVFNRPPPFSPNRPFDLITMNNRPVMATAQSADPVVSGILGMQGSGFGDRTNQQQEVMQMGFQQFQFQQMILQQQQLITMIQNQQSQQKAAESIHMEQLQKQILEQQRVIEQLANEQHKLLEQQQQTAQLSENKRQEMLRMQMEYQQKQMKEQQEQLVMQKSMLMQLQSAKPGTAGISSLETKNENQSLRMEKPDMLPKLESASTDKVKSLDDISSPSSDLMENSVKRTETCLDDLCKSIESKPSETGPKESGETSECFTTKAKSVASSIMSAFDLSSQWEINQELSKQTSQEIANDSSRSPGLPKGSLPESSVAISSNAQSVSLSEDLKFDLDQFEEEMHAVLSGSQENTLKTPTKKDSDHDISQPLIDALSNDAVKLSLLSKDGKEDEAENAMNDSNATLETSPPFYEPMLDIEQRLKHIAASSSASQEQASLKPEDFEKDSPSLKSTLSDSIEKPVVESKITDVLERPDIGDTEINDLPNISLNSELQDKNNDSNGPSKLPDYPSINRDATHDSLDSRQGFEIASKDMDDLIEADLDAILPSVPTDASPIPTISTPDEPEDSLLSSSPSRPQLNRQEGRLSFYQAAESEVERKAYLEDLDASVEQMHQQCMEYCKKVPNMTIDGFTRLWNDLAQVEELDSCSFTADAGRKNLNKNRYRDILPWDHTRVRLQSLSDDYINANHINNLTPCSPRYIASQGPIPQCFVDFWTMVWEQRCPVIVMLTNEVEGTKLKCHPYWPRKMEQMTEYGEMSVILNDQEAGPSWKCRTFMITHNETKETRIVKHLQFTSWPDYGIPNTPYDLLAFNDEVRKWHKALDPMLLSPLLLHCSAGVGRTGTFACVYSASEEIMGGNGLVEIPGLIRKLRQCRFHMVQRKEQLIFCYQAILCYAQQFLAEEQMKQEGRLNSTSESSELSLPSNEGAKALGSNTSAEATGSERIQNEEHGDRVSSNKDEETIKIQPENSGREDSETLQTDQKTEDENPVHGETNSAEIEPEANSISAANTQSNVADTSLASTSSNDLNLELEQDGSMDERYTGREREDTIPKFKVKSDIFASKSPPHSPGFNPLTHDDKP